LASYTKDADLLKLGNMLVDAGWDMLGSAGTAKYLSENGIACRDVAEIVGEPILGHRVVTLSREIHAGLLSRDEDAAELEKLGIPRIDLVYVTLYPLEETISGGGSQHDVIEKTDIGGPALLRAAGKGRRIVISDASQIDEAERLIKGEVDEQLLGKLVAAAERRCADYIGVSAGYWEQQADY
jgi:phosphoribosylaminoimidazolecarboxamide formyltransferase/IMP cyclohydrolase